MVVKDAVTRNTLITRATVFHVDRQLIQALTGSVEVSAAQVHQGDSQACHERAKNLAASPIQRVTLTSQLFKVDGNQMLNTGSRTVDFTANGQQQDTQSINTNNLAIGTYACVLLAEAGGQGHKMRL